MFPFYLKANTVSSTDYELKSSMFLPFLILKWSCISSYLNRKPSPLKERGAIPEGTRVTWKIDTEDEKLEWMENSTCLFRETKMSLHYLKYQSIQIIKLLHRIIGLKTMKN
jgi:hypothetical protein